MEIPHSLRGESRQLAALRAPLVWAGTCRTHVMGPAVARKLLERRQERERWAVEGGHLKKKLLVPRPSVSSN